MRTKEQKNAYAKYWYQKNKEKKLAYFKEYNKVPENKKRLLERNARYKIENPKHFRDYMREYMRKRLGIKKFYKENSNKMKINLSKDEVYEIEIPKEIEVEQFHNILGKLLNIEKIIKINSIIGTTFNKFKQGYQERETIKRKPYKFTKNNPNPFFDTKEKILDLMQYAYHGTEADKRRIEKLVGMKWTSLSCRFWNFRERYNIKPQEIGLIAFGTIRNPKGIKVPNYIIKSYTGIFDEDGKEIPDVSEVVLKQ